jgi:ABC-type methionine transport system permease subunit
VRTGGIGESKISGVEGGSGVGELAGAYGNEFSSKMTCREMIMQRVTKSRQ